MNNNNNQDNSNNPKSGGFINTQLESVDKKSWGNFAPLGSSRGKLSGRNTLTQRLDAMKRKPLPPLRKPIR